jgi:hypothetical protein
MQHGGLNECIGTRYTRNRSPPEPHSRFQSDAGNVHRITNRDVC